MALWRFGRGWPEPVLKSYLKALAHSPVNFKVQPEAMTAENGWTIDGSQAHMGTERHGPPTDNGLFMRAKQAIINYDFSDPHVVVGHFDPRVPLQGRPMLLEIKVLGLHFLGAVRVQQTRDESNDHETVFGFRYDTLRGHIESGVEWFLLTKNHQTGEVSFRIEAHWRMGHFPNWWSRFGFKILGEHYRAYWRRRAAARLIRLAHQPVEKAVATPGHLAHRGDSTPQRTEPVADGA
ncbi:MAG: DUF1990 family protein [Abitibacteriaceae bacterium]|nr:DUF1990 family protein [Abditibacteriaceae bacterium]